MSENVKKGQDYEDFILSSLNHEMVLPIFNSILQDRKTIHYSYESNLWKNVPWFWLIEMKYFNDCKDGIEECRFKKRQKIEMEKNEEKNVEIDIGTDILIRFKSINLEKIEYIDYIVIQCKNYSSTLRIDDLAGYFYTLSMFPHVYGCCIYSSPKLSKHLEFRLNSRMQYLYYPMNESEFYETFEKKELEFKLRPYQEDVKNIILHTEKKRGCIVLPCGVGKTNIAIEISKKWESKFSKEGINIIFILSPLRMVADQNLKKFEQNLNNEEDSLCSLLFSSDEKGIRDISTIFEKIETCKNLKTILISCTFDSCDILMEFLHLYYKDAKSILGWIDEFHMVSKNQLFNKDSFIHQLLMFDSKNIPIFSMSATPRIYELEKESDIESSEELLGSILYEMKMDEAIEEKWICDYEVYFPYIYKMENLIEEYISLDLFFNEKDKECLLRMHFLMYGVLYTGARKTIIYVEDKKDLENCLNMVSLLNNEMYHLNEILEITFITSETSQEERDIILEKMQNSKRRMFLFSIYILDQAIDIPSCDSVYFSSVCKTKSRLIQRANRSTRLDPLNPNKKAKWFIWGTQKEDWMEIIATMKEIDPSFIEKMSCISMEYSSSGSSSGSSSDLNKEKNEKHEISKEEFEKMVLEYCIKVQVYISIKKEYEQWKKKVSKIKFLDHVQYSNWLKQYENGIYFDKYKEPKIFFGKYFEGWISFLSINTNQWMFNSFEKKKWISYLHEKKCLDIDSYIHLYHKDKKIPSIPQEWFKDYTNFSNEMKYKVKLIKNYSL